ncbi:nitrogen fixation protein FixH [Bradyrhizobium sp. LM6.11]
MASAPKPLTRTKVFLILVAFFGVVIGVNVTMAKLAIATLARHRCRQSVCGGPHL